MFRTLSVWVLLGGILSADQAADRKAIDALIGSLFVPQVRSDPNRMGELTTKDFDGDLSSIPIHRALCETSCEVFKIRSLKFVTEDVVVVDGEITTGDNGLNGPTAFPLPSSSWVMILKRDGPAWRLSTVHLINSITPVQLTRFW